MRDGVMQEVKVLVPEERVAEFYQWFGEWLENPDRARGVAEVRELELEKWQNSPEDIEVARKVWGLFSPRARKLFDFLMDSAGDRFPADFLAEKIGLTTGAYGVSGVLGGAGKRCYSVGKSWMWEWEIDEEKGSMYAVEPEIAEIFAAARTAN